MTNVKVEAREQVGGSSINKYTRKQPLRTSCGIEVVGQFGTYAHKKGIAAFRVDDVREE